MRTRLLPLACLAGLAGAAVAVLPALATGDTPPSTGAFTAVDIAWHADGGGSTVTIAPGGVVRFAYPVGGSAHNADFGSGPQPSSCRQTGGASSGAVPPLPGSPTGVGWSGDCTFAAAGTYRFFCDLHPGMTGTVVVAADTGTPTDPRTTPTDPTTPRTTPTDPRTTPTTPARTTPTTTRTTPTDPTTPRTTPTDPRTTPTTPARTTPTTPTTTGRTTPTTPGGGGGDTGGGGGGTTPPGVGPAQPQASGAPGRGPAGGSGPSAPRGGGLLRTARSQHGSSVRATIGLGRARGRVRVELLAARRALGLRGRGQAVAGSVSKRSAGPGDVAFDVALGAAAKRALSRHGTLALVVRVTVTPAGGGKPRTASARVTLSRRSVRA